jgi:hypothetical protein
MLRRNLLARFAAVGIGTGLVLSGALSCLPSGATSTTTDGALLEPCARAPLQGVLVFLNAAPESVSSHFAATVAEVSGPGDLGLRQFVLRDGAVPLGRLSVRAGNDAPPMRSGSSYRFQVDQSGEVPKTGGLLVWDDAGFLFAAASDLGIGAGVLREGIPGFELELAPAACASRPTGDCFDSIINLELRVRHAGAAATLYHGDVARLGRYEVRCLIAQKAVSNARCADAAPHGVSYTITRLD